jgi:putative membrane protein
MITYNPKDWFKLILQFHKSDTFRILLPLMLVLGILTSAIVYFEVNVLNTSKSSVTIFHSILGFVLSMLLVFRINSAYDRWWEGRKIWGGLVNTSRNLAIKLLSYMPDLSAEERKHFQILISSLVFSIRNHLRDANNADEIPEVIKNNVEFQNANHKPVFLSEKLFTYFNQVGKKHSITMGAFIEISKEINNYMEFTGACERIRNTPIPFSYSLFLKKIIFIYIISMPFAFAPEFKYWSVPMVIFIFYAFASLELVSEEIEDPFGTDDNDLPLDTISATIRKNCSEILLKKNEF